MKNINFISLATLFFFILFGITAATVSHNASEITAGTFGTGDYIFIGNVELQKGNEVFLSIRNTEANGRQYALVSAGSVGGIGVGKFSIYDKTADASRLTIDANGNIGIGTTSPTERLVVVGGNGIRIKETDVGTESIYLQGSIARFNVGANTVVPFLVNMVGGSFANLAEFQDGGTTRLVIQKTGNVGIGTTNPGTTLQVVGGYVQIPVKSSWAPDTECDATAEIGRIYVYSPGTTTSLCHCGTTYDEGLKWRCV